VVITDRDLDEAHKIEADIDQVAVLSGQVPGKHSRPGTGVAIPDLECHIVTFLQRTSVWLAVISGETPEIYHLIRP
jgi:hypothetical protein